MSEPSSRAGRSRLDTSAVERLRSEAAALTEPMVEFARKLVRTWTTLTWATRSAGLTLHTEAMWKAGTFGAGPRAT